MLCAGPQSLHSPVPANVSAQSQKLHQLSAPVRPSLAPDEIGGAGGGSSWNDSEVARQVAILTEERDFLRKYG